MWQGLKLAVVQADLAAELLVLLTRRLTLVCRGAVDAGAVGVVGAAVGGCHLR